jgi:hypothetical protein
MLTIRTPFFKEIIFPLPGLAISCALSTGIPPNALMGVPIIGLLIDLAATMNLTNLFMTELIS